MPDECEKRGVTMAQYFRDGHPGIIVPNPTHTNSKVTTYKDDYYLRRHEAGGAQTKGIRYRLTEQALTEEIMNKLDKEHENDYCDEPTSYVTEMKEHFNVPGFVHKVPAPTTVKIFSVLLFSFNFRIIK